MERFLTNLSDTVIPLLIGGEKCEKGHHFGPAVRSHYLLHYVLSGYGQYTVNGKTAPTTLSDDAVYRFEVALDYFRAGEPDTHIQKCRVITDKGVTLLELENMGDRFHFTLTAPDSHYFYLCLLDSENRKTCEFSDT